MDNDAKKTFGQRIKTRRLEIGISQLELAQKIHKASAAYIAFIESGDRNISTMDMMLLAKALDTSVSDLIGESKSGDATTRVVSALRTDKELSESERRALIDIYKSIKKRHENR